MLKNYPDKLNLEYKNILEKINESIKNNKINQNILKSLMTLPKDYFK
jgi:hypothetical protein